MGEQTREELLRASNKDATQQWAMDPHIDPWSVPLEEMNPAHPAIFEAGTSLPWFERLRQEAPVHRCENSQFGPYWSISKYEDIQYVDSQFELFYRISGTAVFGLAACPWKVSRTR